MHSKTLFKVITVISFIFAIMSGEVEALAGKWTNARVDLSFQNAPLHSVLSQIHDQTGISVVFDETLANNMVTGAYKTDALDAIERLFRDMNIIIQVDGKTRTIVVRTFGVQRYLVVGAKNLVETFADLDALHASQKEEIKKILSDESAVVEDGGITLNQLREIHRQQQVEIHNLVSDESAYVEEGGVTLGQLRDMHRRQLDEIQRLASDDSRFVEEVGVSLGELRELHSQQQKEKETILRDGSQRDEDGMTRDELRALHSSQKKLIREMLSDRSGRIDEL
jgi:type II secretory pathway component GspD/PulD (secretin)